MSRVKDMVSCDVCRTDKGIFASVETIDFGTFSYTVNQATLEVFDEDMSKIGNIRQLNNVLDSRQIIYSYANFYSVELTDIIEEVCLSHALKIARVGQMLRQRI